MEQRFHNRLSLIQDNDIVPYLKLKTDILPNVPICEFKSVKSYDLKNNSFNFWCTPLGCTGPNYSSGIYFLSCSICKD